MDEKETLTEYEKQVVAVLDEIKGLFLKKDRTYNDGNPFLNFIVGGRLLAGDGSYLGCFEAVKAYVAKHIANLYSHNVVTEGLEESLKDIATYMVIAVVMKRRYDAQVKKDTEQHEA